MSFQKPCRFFQVTVKLLLNKIFATLKHRNETSLVLYSFFFVKKPFIKLYWSNAGNILYSENKLNIPANVNRKYT